ncbi:MAG: Gfo/Idh/MocA family oxidoreductase [Acidobacteriota bacterium]|nr:Gfo/Idh/MocA family oxidoreductase [Acidobacteriota bacterium]
MAEKIRWGVLGAANIAVKKVIPAMQSGEFCEVAAIASRSSDKARRAAAELNIPKFYGAYEELLADAEIDAIYNPLPNNLHVEWTIKAARAGKHVLCEKPLGMSAAEAGKLIAIRDETGVKIQEAFMVRTHPQWLAVRDLIEQNRIGKVRAITGFFSYYNDDANNIRNRVAAGGGALFDIGCYCINISRFVLGEEPRRVSALIEADESSGIDKLTSAIMDFPACHSTFTCSTRLTPYQRMQFFGSHGRIEVEIPFNIPTETATRIFVDDGADLYGANIEIIEIPAANQYTIQGDLFSKAILEKSEQATSLEDSIKNIAVIDAIFRAAESGNFEDIETF